MLTNLNDMLTSAYQNHRAIGAFNVYSYDTLRGVVDAARAENAPVIVAFGKKYLRNMSLNDMHAMAEALAQGELPVCLHLDHCDDVSILWQAIRAGFGSVMYDGSALPFEENACNTRLVCDIAHACGVSVEAELGSLAAGDGSHEGTAHDVQAYTDPAQAAAFVRLTGVDALAVSIGTVHGLYKGTPNIRVDILKQINAVAGVPLVLHGGSGTPESTLRTCIQHGIAKINVNTEISAHVVAALRHALAGESPHLSALCELERRAVSEVVRRYIRLFKG